MRLVVIFKLRCKECGGRVPGSQMTLPVSYGGRKNVGTDNEVKNFS